MQVFSYFLFFNVKSSESEEEIVRMCRPARSAAIVSKAISEAQQEYEDQEMPMPPKQPFKRRYVSISIYRGSENLTMHEFGGGGA